jgi:dienelactone hydrolase
MRRVILFLYLALTCAGLSCSRGVQSETKQEILIPVKDGTPMDASFYVPEKKQQPPGLILVHRYGGNRALWEGFAQMARQAGMMVIATDLRERGKNLAPEQLPVKGKHMSEVDLDAALSDIDTAKTYLCNAGAHPKNLAIIGEGLGANLALHYALKSPDIQAVVMISPGLEYNGVRTENEIKQLTNCPTLLVTSEGDAYAAMSSSALKSAAPVFSELRTWPGAAHGTDLFASHPESIQYILQWLGTVLKEK